jgi:CubicO group peptidase (beta-lactamase class C family)
MPIDFRPFVTSALVCLHSTVYTQVAPVRLTSVTVVDSVARVAMREQFAPALGLALTRQGRVVFRGAYGLANVTQGIAATENTLWYVASTSKSFTGFGMAHWLEAPGRSLDTDARTLVPGLTAPNGVPATRLTLRAFLSHTTGLTDDAIVQSASFTAAVPSSRWPSLLALATVDTAAPLVYSNLGYVVGGLVLDQAIRGGWPAYLERHVFRPAGMRQTFARVSAVPASRVAVPHTLRATGEYVAAEFEKRDATMSAAGGHLSTLADLARWTIVQMDSGRIDGRQVFPVARVVRAQTMLASHTNSNSRRFAMFDRDGWGIGWDIGSYHGERMVSRFGSYHTTRSHVSFLPARRVGVVAMSTGGLGSGAVDLLASLYYDLERGDPQAVPRAAARMDSLRARRREAGARISAQDSTRAARQQPTAHPVTVLRGRFHSPAYGALVLTGDTTGLRFEWGVLRGRAEVFDAAHDEYRLEIAGSGSVLRPVFDAEGRVQSVRIGAATFTR